MEISLGIMEFQTFDTSCTPSGMYTRFLNFPARASVHCTYYLNKYNIEKFLKSSMSLLRCYLLSIKEFFSHAHENLVQHDHYHVKKKYQLKK